MQCEDIHRGKSLHLCLLPICVHAILCGSALCSRDRCVVRLGYNEGVVIRVYNKLPWRVSQPCDLEGREHVLKMAPALYALAKRQCLRAC